MTTFQNANAGASEPFLLKLGRFRLFQEWLRVYSATYWIDGVALVPSQAGTDTLVFVLHEINGTCVTLNSVDDALAYLDDEQLQQSFLAYFAQFDQPHHGPAGESANRIGQILG